MSIGIVIPVGPGRADNLNAVMRCLQAQTVQPAGIVVVQDGFDAKEDWVGPIVTLACAKHEPGREQPRNVGVRVLRHTWPDITHVWFLDSDICFGPRCLEEMTDALAQGSPKRIIVGPYDWLGEGDRPTPGAEYMGTRSDPRWAMFDQYEPAVALTNDLSAGLACFSGNLMWPIDEFMRVGGFWSEIHHGRCEDGELGLRAVAMGVPISFAAKARGWHLHHDINYALALERNARDVPMLNARHPWVQGADVFMVDRDGKAFDVKCSKCDEQITTNGWWTHAAECGVDYCLPVSPVK